MIFSLIIIIKTLADDITWNPKKVNKKCLLWISKYQMCHLFLSSLWCTMPSYAKILPTMSFPLQFIFWVLSSHYRRCQYVYIYANIHFCSIFRIVQFGLLLFYSYVEITIYLSQDSLKNRIFLTFVKNQKCP